MVSPHHFPQQQTMLSTNVQMMKSMRFSITSDVPSPVYKSMKSGSKQNMEPMENKWTWPFETKGETLTTQRGKTKNGFRQPDPWVGAVSVPTYPVYILSKGRWALDKTWR